MGGVYLATDNILIINSTSKHILLSLLQQPLFSLSLHLSAQDSVCPIVRKLSQNSFVSSQANILLHFESRLALILTDAAQLNDYRSLVL